MTTWVLVLPYARPPLTLNKHLHYMPESKIRVELKWATFAVARAARLVHLDAGTVELVWFKGDNRRADSDNISPTLKPCIDGLVAAHVFTDDNATHVRRTSQRVIYRREDPLERGPVVELHITEVSLTEASNLPGFQR